MLELDLRFGRDGFKLDPYHSTQECAKQDIFELWRPAIQIMDSKRTFECLCIVENSVCVP